ncbi:MAG TPA: IclR family transcriptional regulator [Burkholderiaceae bacterium]|nr:IclR family transcriptional regulator [Burkholderiaceae bacterium]
MNTSLNEQAPDASQASDRQFAITLARGMAVLRAFTADQPVLGNREICDRTGLAKATVSRLTYTLTLLGYLSHVNGLQKYRLGPGVLSLGYPFLASLTVRQVIRPIMEKLAQETGCTINLGMLDRTRVVFVETCRLDESNMYRPDIGSTRPLLATSVGRALLLSSDPKEREALLNRIRLEDPAEYQRLLPVWNADVKEFPRRGYCHSRGDWKQEIHGIAAPIRRPVREERIALNCTLTGAQASKDRLAKVIAPLLLRAVHEIENATGLI